MLHRLSMEQVLSVWSDLESAYHGKNDFGGDVVEIYFYRLQPFDVLNPVPGGSTADRYAARAALISICRLFSEMRKAIVTIDGFQVFNVSTDDLGPQRAHVRVERIRT